MPITFDIETVPCDAAAEFIPAPNLDAILPAENLKDPVKIAESIEKRKAAALAEYRGCLSKAALDWNLSRIVAIGYDDAGKADALAFETEAAEAEGLRRFWARAKGKQLIGFCARTFDVPTLIQRSRLLGVPYPNVNLSRYGRGDVTDLRDELTFGDARYEAIMPRSLKAFARRFGIPVDDAIDGQQIPALVAAGDWAGVLAHVTSDVQLTVALARRIGVLNSSDAREPEPVF